MSKIYTREEDNQNRFNDILMVSFLLIFTVFFALFFLPIPLNYHPFAWHSSGIDMKLWETQANTIKKYHIVNINNTDFAAIDGVTYVVSGGERFASMKFQGVSALVDVNVKGLSYYATAANPNNINEPYSFHYEHAVDLVNSAVHAINENEQRLAVLQADRLKFENSDASN